VEDVFAAGAVIIVVGVFEAVEGCGDDVVEIVDGAGAAEGIGVEEAGVLFELGEALGFEAFEKDAGVEAVETARDGVGPAGEAEGGGDGTGGVDDAGTIAGFAEPAEEHVAAEGSADGIEPGGAIGLTVSMEAAEDPIDFGGVAGMVEARGGVEFAGATAEMADGAGPAEAGDVVHEGAGVVAVGTAFEAVEENEEGLAGLAVDEVDVDEVVVGSGPAFAVVGGTGDGDEFGGIDGLEVATWEPAGGTVVRHGWGGMGNLTQRR